MGVPASDRTEPIQRPVLGGGRSDETILPQPAMLALNRLEDLQIQNRASKSSKIRCFRRSAARLPSFVIPEFRNRTPHRVAEWRLPHHSPEWEDGATNAPSAALEPKHDSGRISEAILVSGRRRRQTSQHSVNRVESRVEVIDLRRPDRDVRRHSKIDTAT